MKRRKYEKNLTRNIKKILGTIAVMMTVASSAAMISSATTINATGLQGVELYYTTTSKYTGSFTPASGTSTSPWVQYRNVYSEGNYYVGSRYKNTNYSYINMESTKYYASSIADGRVTSVQLKANKPNEIYVKGTTNLYLQIDEMRWTYVN